MKSLFESIENILIAISRYFLITFGALALAAALIILFYSLTLILDSPNLDNSRLDNTKYSEIKTELFPQPKKNVMLKSTENNLNESSLSANEDLSEPVDKRYAQIRNLIANHFEDSSEAKSFIFNNITPRSIADYLQSNYSSYNFPYDEFLDNLVAIFLEIKDISDFQRIGDLNARLDLITKVIDIAYQNFLYKIEQREKKNSSEIAESAANNIKGTSYLTYVLFALAFYAGAVLYLMIFKVEIDLRRISPAIEDK